MYADPGLLPQQLNFYTVKPLYIFMLYLLARICGDFVTASILISALAYAGVCAIAWLWLKPYLTPGVHLLASLLIVITPALVDLARLSSPDSLSTLLTVVGLYLIAERHQYLWGSLVFFVDLAVRPDALIIAGSIWLVLLLRDREQRQWYAVAGILGLFTVLLIKRAFHAYTWPILFHNSFISRIPNPREVSIYITPASYLNVVITNLEIYVK